MRAGLEPQKEAVGPGFQDAATGRWGEGSETHYLTQCDLKVVTGYTPTLLDAKRKRGRRSVRHTSRETS